MKAHWNHTDFTRNENRLDPRRSWWARNEPLVTHHPWSCGITVACAAPLRSTRCRIDLPYSPRRLAPMPKKSQTTGGLQSNF